jgi:NADH-quinone oxidoreductase subunit I
MFNDAKALAKGLWTVVRHMRRPAVTVQYPDVKRTPYPKFRGRHRLYKHDDGLERCIGCSLCAAACPSQAIYVKAAENDPEHPVSPGERYAEIYEINMIRCIYCGFCEEACPVDAIKLGPEYELADFQRTDFVYTKEMLLDPARHAPRRQYHPDVDRSVDERGVHTTLGDVYRTHHPIGGVDVRSVSHADPHSAAAHGGATPSPVATPTTGSERATTPGEDERGRP